MLVVWPVVPRTVTLGGPFPLDFSFSRGFYYGWKKNEWANLFTFSGSAGIFQMLPSHPLPNAFIVCGTIRGAD